jgi:hypothetical protein
MKKIHLYIDDSGNRSTDRKNSGPRRDGFDCFALGGILIAEEGIAPLLEAHAGLVKKWGLSNPLHSTKIRGRRDAFAWLGTDADRETEFLNDLETMILNLPIKGLACVVDRPGYVARYSERYPQPWLLCKTAFAILVERAAKYALRSNGRLQIFFEQAGKTEDRDVLKYARSLETEGMPFDPQSSKEYDVLRPDDFKAVIIGQPNRITKKVPMAQIADLVLYAMAKGGYDSTYRPYAKLIAAGCIIDAELKPEEKPLLGVKYSCLGPPKNKARS